MSTSLQRMTLLLWMNAIFICSVAAQCTMPSDLRGVWIRGRDKKTLTFNDTHVSGLDVAVAGDRTHSVFECFILEGTVLVVKSSTTFTPALSSSLARVYFCFDLRQVGTNNYYMYERADPQEFFFGGARVIGHAEGTTVTSSMTCTKQSSEVPFFSLVKAGAAFQQTCHDVIRGHYNYTFTRDGGTTSCEGDSLLDVCSDVRKPTFDYTKCTQQMMGSTGGIFSCLAAVTSSSYQFVLLYNEQTSDSAKFSCVIIDQQADTTYMSYRPDYCDPNMLPTTAPSSGGKFVLKHLTFIPTTTTTTTTSADQTTTTTSVDQTTTNSFPIAAIAAAVAAVSLVALIAVIIGLIVYKKRQSQVNAAPNTPMTAEEGDGKTADGNANGTAHANGTANGKKPDGQTQGDQPSTPSTPNHIHANEPTEVDENSAPTRLHPLNNDGRATEGEAISTPRRLPPISNN